MTSTKSRGRAWRLASWLLQIGAFLLLFVLLRAWLARDLALGPAPEFSAYLLDNTPVALADYRGAPMLLHFWATWCAICRLEEGEIVRVSQRYPVLTVAMQSGTALDVYHHLNARERELAVVNDPNAQLAALYGVKAVPSTFIIDHQGRIVFRKQGYAPPLELRMRLWLASWL